MDDAFQVLLAALCSEFALVHGPRVNDASVGEQDLQFEHVIDGLAMNDRMRAGGIVGDHAADGCPARGGNVRREMQAVRLHVLIEVIEYAAGFDADPLLVNVDFEHAIEVAGKIENDARSNRLPGLRRAAAPRRDRHAKMPADLERRTHIVGRFRDDDAERTIW